MKKKVSYWDQIRQIREEEGCDKARAREIYQARKQGIRPDPVPADPTASPESCRKFAEQRATDLRAKAKSLKEQYEAVEAEAEEWEDIGEKAITPSGK